MVVGHNPGLEDLIHYLSEGRLAIPDDGKVLPTSALAQLEMGEEWQNLERGCATLISLTRPGQVPDELAAEAAEESGVWSGSDYFFTQSAVLPYR
jgi:phosphohistidine phosphatase